MYAQRKTIKSKVSITGIGLHSGIYTRVALHPAPAGSGITFIRADLHGLRIPATSGAREESRGGTHLPFGLG